MVTTTAILPPSSCVPQAIQFVAEHGEVCPAGWKPGGKTMVADPEKSLEYFSAAGGEQVTWYPLARVWVGPVYLLW